MNSLKKMHGDPKLTHHHTETTFNIQLLPGFKDKINKNKNNIGKTIESNMTRHDSAEARMRECMRRKTPAIMNALVLSSLP